jgi:hypothetical protein
VNPARKAIVVMLVAAALVVGFWQGHVVREQRNEIALLQAATAKAQQQIVQLTRDNDEDGAKLEALLTDLLKIKTSMTAPGAPASSDPTAVAMQNWMTRVKNLRARFERSPNERTPEMQFLTDEDWLAASRTDLVTEQDYRRAMSRARQAAQNKVIAQLQPALSKYENVNNGAFPTDLAQLQPYLDPPLDESILQRLEIVPADQVPIKIGGSPTVLTLKAAPIDDLYDTRFVIGVHGSGMTGVMSPIMSGVMSAFRIANSGEQLANASQLMPYATTPEQQAAVQQEIQRDGGK